MFNLLTSFAITFLAARWITYCAARPAARGPFRDVRVAAATSTTSCRGS